MKIIKLKLKFKSEVVQDLRYALSENAEALGDEALRLKIQEILQTEVDKLLNNYVPQSTNT